MTFFISSVRRLILCLDILINLNYALLKEEGLCELLKLIEVPLLEKCLQSFGHYLKDILYIVKLSR
jgi:hypothetical protein